MAGRPRHVLLLDLRASQALRRHLVDPARGRDLLSADPPRPAVGISSQARPSASPPCSAAIMASTGRWAVWGLWRTSRSGALRARLRCRRSSGGRRASRPGTRRFSSCSSRSPDSRPHSSKASGCWSRRAPRTCRCPCPGRGRLPMARSPSCRPPARRWSAIFFIGIVGFGVAAIAASVRGADARPGPARRRSWPPDSWRFPTRISRTPVRTSVTWRKGCSRCSSECSPSPPCGRRGQCGSPRSDSARRVFSSRCRCSPAGAAGRRPGVRRGRRGREPTHGSAAHGEGPRDASRARRPVRGRRAHVLRGPFWPGRTRRSIASRRSGRSIRWCRAARRCSARRWRGCGQARPGFAVVLDHALDGQEGLRFRNSHPIIDRYIRDNFQPLPGFARDPMYRVYRSRLQP